MSMRATLLVLVCSLVLTPAFSLAADAGLEGRVARLERILSNQSMSDLLLQIQRLKQEMQKLRGQVELQQHEISTLKQQQRDQYLDIDSRLRGQSGGAAASPPVAGPKSVPAEGGAPTTSPERKAEGAPDLAVPKSEAAQQVSEKKAYGMAFDLLKQRRYDEAVRGFEDLLALYPNGEFADNARYWLGETYYVKRDYAAALTEFQRVLANYPLSPKVPAAMLKMGYIQYEQSEWNRSRATLQDVVKKFPDSTEARLAQSRLERMTREGH
ncbi:MAG: tol-pal system protein YbgF [Pseudomonadota bacterium]|nr:tol-pal system protein YbgF [Pseudomonadota bacterium]